MGYVRRPLNLRDFMLEGRYEDDYMKIELENGEALFTVSINREWTVHGRFMPDELSEVLRVFSPRHPNAVIVHAMVGEPAIISLKDENGEAVRFTVNKVVDIDPCPRDEGRKTSLTLQ